MYDRIIVPLDEGTGVDALDHARPLARTMGCTLTLLHVHHAREAPTELEGLPQYRYQGVVESWDERDRAVEAHEVEWLEALANDVAAAEPALTVTSAVVHAPLARSLRDRDESVLVVVSAGAVETGEVDPAVQELLRAGNVPVLLTRPGMPILPIRRVLVALDGSPFSEEIVGPALEVARSLDAGLTLMEVVVRHSGLVRLLRPGERSAESAGRFLRAIRQRLPAGLAPVEIRVVESGDPAEGIVGEAREEIGLVAMATHGRGGLRRFILGSVAEAVVRSSPVPVLLYRPLGTASGSRVSDAAEVVTS